MCRWVIYKGKAIALEELLIDPENSLADQSKNSVKSVYRVNGDGFGIGWYSDFIDTPGIYKAPLPAWNNRNFMEIARHIKAKLFCGHVRATTGETESSRENCHPFRYKNWMLIHNGGIGEFKKLKKDLDFKIADKYYPYKDGCTDTESMFFLALTFGLETNPKLALEKMLVYVLELMDQYKITEPLHASIAVTNGNDVYALRYANKTLAPSLFYKTQLNSIEIVSEPLEFSSKDYVKIENLEFLHIDSSNTVKISKLQLQLPF